MRRRKIVRGREARLGEALREHVEGPILTIPEIRERPTARSLLLHPTRLQLYRILANLPGLHLHSLASYVDASASTLHWHLRILLDEKYLECHSSGRYRYYFPPCRLDLDDIEPLVQLYKKDRLLLLQKIRKEGEVSQTELALASEDSQQLLSWRLEELVLCGLLSARRKGRRRLYSPTGLLEEIAKRMLERFPSFLEELEKRLEADGLLPVLLSDKDDQIVFQLDLGTSNAEFAVVKDPVAAVLAEGLISSP